MFGACYSGCQANSVKAVKKSRYNWMAVSCGMSTIQCSVWSACSCIIYCLSPCRHVTVLVCRPRMGPGYPLSAFAPPLSVHFVIFCSVLLFPFFRLTPPSRPNNFSFFDFNEIWYVRRGRRVMHDGMQYGPIRGQGQGHEPMKVGNSTVFKGYLFPVSYTHLTLPTIYSV